MMKWPWRKSKREWQIQLVRNDAKEIGDVVAVPVTVTKKDARHVLTHAEVARGYHLRAVNTETGRVVR